MENNINNNLEVLFNKMENFVSTKTVVGEPIHIGEVIMLPLVDVAFGVGSGSRIDNNDDKKSKGAKEGIGLGAKVTPSAVLVIKENTVQFVDVKNKDSLNKLIDMAPSILAKLNLGSIFSKDKKDKENEDIEIIKSENNQI